MTTKNEAIHNAQSAMEYTLRALDNGNDLTYAKSCLQGAITAIKQALPEQASRMIAPAYGIIDPDYARVFTQARIVAWQYGYACVMHGSFTRDLDLLLVPWTDTAIGNEDQLLKLIAQGCGLRFSDGKEEVVFSTVDWSEKPHGRKACSLYFPAFGDRRWIDISIFTKPQAQQAQGPTWTDGCTEENCLRCKTHPKHRGNMQHAGIGSYPPAPAQAITPETGNAATTEASAITSGNGQAQEPVDEQSAFETWVRNTRGSPWPIALDKADAGNYMYLPAIEAWQVWQARAALCPICPAPKQAEPAWQPIETAPFYTDVLIFIEGGGVTIGSAAPKFGWTWHETDDAPEDAKAIGWMPLPQPPEAKA